MRIMFKKSEMLNRKCGWENSYIRNSEEVGILVISQDNLTYLDQASQ